MNRLSKSALASILLTLSALARAEALAETGVPDFALGKLTIAKMGVFLDKNAAFANHLVTNLGPLAKNALTNVLYKIPVDESLNFDGPAQIFLLPPLTFNAVQETASIFPVSNAQKLKANIIATYGEPVEQDGTMTFTIPQVLPQPDLTLVVKIIDGKVLLASNADVIKKLNTAAAAPVQPTSDAELIISVPALKKLYGEKAEAALQLGALLASENIQGLKTVTDQLDEIIKTIWEFGTIELRLDYDKGSENVSAELAVAPLKGTRLAEIFASPPPGLEGKNAGLLAAGTPINLALRLNGKAIYNFLPKLGVAPKQFQPLVKLLADFFTGETTVAIEPAKRFVLLTQGADATPLSKKIETLHLGLIEIGNKSLADQGLDGDDGYSYVPAVESAEHHGTALTLRKFGTRAAKEKFGIKTQDERGYIAQAEVGAQTVVGVGSKPEAGLKALIDNAAAKTAIPPDQLAAFDAPAPGTLLFASIKLLEMIRIAAAEYLPDNINPEQVVGGLPDAPVSVAIFMHGGKVGLRAKLPGKTAGAIYVINARLRRSGIDLVEVLGMGNKKAEEKLPPNIPAPPPQK